MNTVKHLQRMLDVKPTPQDKGLELHIIASAYDKGMININGTPCGDGTDQAQTWITAARIVTSLLEEFQKEVAARHAKKAA